MEPISVVAASVALAAGIAKATATVAEISVDLRDASDDLQNISNELVVFQCFISPLTTGLSRFGTHSNPILAPLVDQINSAVTGAKAVVEKIESVLLKYRGRLTLWLKLRWSLFGVDQVRKLRESLESYKVALGIGLHLMSISIVGEVKNDTEVIREVAEVVKILQKDEILSRLVTQASPTESQTKVELWLEKMADYTTCGETAYQATIIDPDEEPARPTTTTTSNPIPDFPTLSLSLSNSLIDEECGPVSTSFDSRPSASVQDEEEFRFGPRLNNPSTTHLSTATSSDFASTQSNDATILSRTTLPSSFDCDIRSQAGMTDSSFITVPVQKTAAQPSPLAQTQNETSSPRSRVDSISTKIDWSALVPDIITESDFEDIQKATKLDLEAIQLSERRRHALSDDHRERLDSMLVRRLCQDPRSLRPRRRTFCATLLQNGASIEESNGGTLNPVNQVIAQQDWETLSLLLKYGADPNGCTLLDPRQPLAVAASNDVKCVCALVLSGAEIRATEQNEDICGRFCRQEAGMEGRICCTPLLSAFATVRQKGRINIKQFWATQFLLKNGADVNSNTCTTVMGLMVQEWNITSQYRMTKHLLAYGVDMSSPSLTTQLQQASIAGETRLVQLLVENGITIKNKTPLGDSPQTDPIVLAAAHQNWDCVGALLKAATDSTHLYHLIQVFMLKTSLNLPVDTFHRAILQFLANSSHINLDKPLVCNYPRKLSNAGEFQAVSERITVVGLAERILNENGRDRSGILQILRGGANFTKPYKSGSSA